MWVSQFLFGCLVGLIVGWGTSYFLYQGLLEYRALRRDRPIQSAKSADKQP